MKIQKKNTKNVELSYIKWVILHPIIHMKVSMYNGAFTNRCRNVGENTQNIGSASIWVIIPVPFHVGIENFCP